MPKFTLLLSLIFVVSGFSIVALGESADEFCDPKYQKYDALGGSELFQLTEDKIFNTQVHKIVLKVHRETETKLFAGSKSKTEESLFGHVKQFCYYQNLTDKNPEECIYNSAYRVRGNTSRNRLKRQFKVKFNLANSEKLFERDGRKLSLPNEKCIKNQSFYGLQAINLRSGGIGTNDDSMAREMLSGKLIGTLMTGPLRGGATYRSAHAQLFVAYCQGDEYLAEQCSRADYKGLYLLSEELDEKFIQSRFQNDSEKVNGALISTAYFQGGAATENASFDSKNYSTNAFAVKFSKLKLKHAKDSWLKTMPNEVNSCLQKFNFSFDESSDELANLLMCVTVMKVEQMSQSHDWSQLAELFDLSNLLSYMVAVNFTNHWDSLLLNANNDYLYFNPDLKSSIGGKWQVLAWDLDNTMGALASPKVKSYSALQFDEKVKSLLLKAIRSDPKLNEQYLSIYRERIAGFDLDQSLSFLSQIEKNVQTGTRGTWEEKVGINYKAAFDFLEKYLISRHQSVH